METILAAIDASGYAASVCDLAAWAASRLERPLELLHVVQRNDAVSQRHDLSGAIGLGVKSSLLQELTRLDEADARLQVERGRVLLAACEERLRAIGVKDVRPLHRHGGIVETILEREADARLVVIGKRGAGHEFATDDIGSKIERVVRASARPILIASRASGPPKVAVLAYDGSPAAKRALECCAKSALFVGMRVHVVVAGGEDARHRALVDQATAALAGREVTSTLNTGRPEAVVAEVVASIPGPILVMGAYGHPPLRTLIVGSTTTVLIRTVRAPVLLMR